MTVYNHFATELDMFDACSSHWFAGHPPPNPSDWARIDDPAIRTRHGLECIYRYYRQNESMMGNIHRDAPLVPAVAEILEIKWIPLLERMMKVLAAGRRSNSAGGKSYRAAMQLALDFGTWRILTASGLNDDAAAHLAAAMVEAAARAPGSTGQDQLPHELNRPGTPGESIP
jgi:hypothetical protein